MLKSQGLLLLATGTVVAIVAASLLSASGKQALYIQGALHPWLHLLAFGFLTTLLLLSVNSAVLRAVLVSAVILLAFGTEYVEHLVFDTPMETIDVITDTAGVVAAWFFLVIWKSSS